MGSFSRSQPSDDYTFGDQATDDPLRSWSSLRDLYDHPLSIQGIVAPHHMFHRKLHNLAIGVGVEVNTRGLIHEVSPTIRYMNI